MNYESLCENPKLFLQTIVRRTNLNDLNVNDNYNFKLSFHEYNRNNFASIVKNDDISCISVVPKILMDLIKNGENDILKLCRIVIVGGSEITKEIYNYLFDNNINAYISYGMTETASGIAGYFVKNSERGLI